MGNYMQLIGTLTGAFGEFEQDKSDLIIWFYAIFIQVYSICKWLYAK